MLADLAAYLESRGIGSTTATPPSIVTGFVPNVPDVCVILFEYAGRAPILTNDDRNLELPGLQVRTRAGRAGYSAAKTKAKAVEAALLDVQNTELSGTRYLSIVPTGAIALLEWEKGGRPVLVQNFTVRKQM
ncbi:MAG: minor capsid protein [Bacilli bacterium]